MKTIEKMNDLSLKFYVYSREVIPFVMVGLVVFCLMPSTSFAEGVNRLAGLREDVSKTFGTGSDMEYYLYIGEALISGIGWVKTKNIMLLGGLPVLMAFTHWALK